MSSLFAPEELVGGSYRIRELIGEGAMGEVYEADDVPLMRRVALKVALPEAVERGASLRAEAQALAAVRHPSMVTVHALGQHAGNEFLVMERVQGITLDAHVGRMAMVGQRLPIDDALDLLIAITDGLAAVHRAGISHRDLKPANIMVTPGGRLVLMDFGLFRPSYERSDDEIISGTPAYMAPEIAKTSVSPGEGHLADLYALSVIGFELLAGRLPYEAPDPHQMIIKHLYDAVPKVTGFRTDTPEPLAALLMQLMHKDPAERPQDTDAVLWQLRDMRAKVSAPVRRARALRVLIVDDDHFVREVLRMGISAAMPDASITLAKNGVEALKCVASEVPDVMLLDVMMPGMNGTQLAMHLRASRKTERLTIVSISSRAAADDLALMNQLGITRFVPKGRDFAERVVALLRELAR